MYHKLYLTDDAIHNLDEILEYLENRWTEKKVKQLKNKLSNLIQLIYSTPKLFSKSDFHPVVSRAELRNQTTIFNCIHDQRIFVSLHFSEIPKSG